MRTLPLKDALGSAGATFGERQGVEVPLRFADDETEYRFVRDGVGVTDFSHMQKYRVPEENGLDLLDSLFPGSVARVRFGRVLHTFLPDESGMVVADCYVANNDDEYLVLCESLIDDAAMMEVIGRHGAVEAGLEDLTDSQVVLSVDGVRSWAVTRELFGAEVLGLPYLSIERFPFEDSEVGLVRAGKTGEFGYLILAPRETAGALLEALRKSAAKNEGGLCGVEIHNTLRLDGRFFNVYAEGRTVRDPLPLGLQWMIDFDKDSYRGSEEIRARRRAGVHDKVVGVRAAAGCEGFVPGAPVFGRAGECGSLKATCHSYALDAEVGLALLPVGVAYAGLAFRLATSDGPEIRTVSMPPFMPKSLRVKLDEM